MSFQLFFVRLLFMIGSQFVSVFRLMATESAQLGAWMPLFDFIGRVALLFQVSWLQPYLRSLSLHPVSTGSSPGPE